jgi:hypothetical protein
MPKHAHDYGSEFITLPALAARAGVPYPVVNQLANAGKIPGVKRNGTAGHFRAPASAIEFVIQHQQAPTSGQEASPAGSIPPDPAPQDGADAAETPAGSLSIEEISHDDH